MSIYIKFKHIGVNSYWSINIFRSRLLTFQCESEISNQLFFIIAGLLSIFSADFYTLSYDYKASNLHVFFGQELDF